MCTGRGRVTLVVSGVPVGEAGNNPRELARTTALCAGDTTPGQAVFPGDEFLQNLVFDLTGSDDAIGQAAFAYRITSDTGRPTTSTDYVNGH
ncbi:hypothetical protein BJ973_000374 [Actinoplanes tereljensis]|uniref:hypothetical protein n=1 Tax=Paractinoplanes tereljensis TaxID=571912 RepID=UPI001940F42A|nr:hypothetical protein [Actinoplanes tereljensis]